MCVADVRQANTVRWWPTTSDLNGYASVPLAVGLGAIPVGRRALGAFYG
jgi:hypothetical protein